jgi:hypothetical protein
MADQTQPAGQSRSRHPHPTVPAAEDHGHNTGRFTSWLAVAIMIAGFIVGGLGLILGPNWPLFWAGVGVIAVGGIYGLASGIMEDYG